MNYSKNTKGIEQVKDAYISEAKLILTQLYNQYKDQGIVSFYLWGSITRDDWDPKISDIDTLAIVHNALDTEIASTLKQQAKDAFSRDIKFGIQLYGIEELNGQETYTTLSEYQPAGHLLLRFNDWIHVAGKDFERSDFAAQSFTPEEAQAHQIAQSLHALKIVSGELPVDSRRSSGMQSMVEDVVKGAIGALYWEAYSEGHTQNLNYDKLHEIVRDERKELATKLVAIRKANSYAPESIMSLRSEIEKLG